MSQTVMTENAASDLDSVVLTLKSGLTIHIEELRLRQFLRLMKIITHGVLPIADLNKFKEAADSGNEEMFGVQMLSLVLAGVAEAEDATVHFLQSMVSPATLIDKPVLQKSDAEFNKLQWALLDKEMINPDPLDTLSIFEAIILKEAANMQAFVKKATDLFKLARKMGKVSEEETQSLSQILQVSNSSEESNEPSTLSNPRITGQTSTVTTSLSEEYVQSLP